MLCLNMLTKTGLIFAFLPPPFFFLCLGILRPPCSCVTICFVLPHLSNATIISPELSIFSL